MTPGTSDCRFFCFVFFGEAKKMKESSLTSKVFLMKLNF